MNALYGQDLTAEEFAEGYRPVLVPSLTDGHLMRGHQAIAPELVFLFREVRALRADVTRLLALMEQRDQ